MTCHRLVRCFNSASAEPLRVCVVGSGIGGFSTAHYLIKVSFIEESTVNQRKIGPYSN